MAPRSSPLSLSRSGFTRTVGTCRLVAMRANAVPVRRAPDAVVNTTAHAAPTRSTSPTRTRHRWRDVDRTRYHTACTDRFDHPRGTGARTRRCLLDTSVVIDLERASEQDDKEFVDAPNPLN